MPVRVGGGCVAANDGDVFNLVGVAGCGLESDTVTPLFSVPKDDANTANDRRFILFGEASGKTRSLSLSSSFASTFSSILSGSSVKLNFDIMPSSIGESTMTVTVALRVGEAGVWGAPSDEKLAVEADDDLFGGGASERGTIAGTWGTESAAVEVVMVSCGGGVCGVVGRDGGLSNLG